MHKEKGKNVRDHFHDKHFYMSKPQVSLINPSTVVVSSLWLTGSLKWNGAIISVINCTCALPATKTQTVYASSAQSLKEMNVKHRIQ